MKEPKFKQGDWCFCEFKLQQVKKTEEDRITEVSDGFISHSSSDLSDRCYPFEMKYKLISDEVAYWNRTFRELHNNALNYSDLNRKLIEMWCEMCDNADNEETLKTLYRKLSEFGNAIVSKVRDLSYEEIDGVRLFRR
jgi:hypothetical protein